jgi:hypothetical protein
MIDIGVWVGVVFRFLLALSSRWRDDLFLCSIKRRWVDGVGLFFCCGLITYYLMPGQLLVLEEEERLGN